jgi:serine/threonine-protein kinase
MKLNRTPTLKIGETVARYRIEGILGSGGMGHVYLARDTELRRTVAIKLVDPGRQSAHDLVREARLAASLDHPSICTIHGVAYLGEEPMLVMEHIKGIPLSKVIRGRRAVAVATALDFARQIVDAIAHAHDRGVVHGDLKSSNIMVGPNRHITILDFGLAVLQGIDNDVDEIETTRRSPSSGAAGTVPYMAPELIRGAQPSIRSDIWALGVLLFEMVVGRRPFSGATPYEMASNILVNQRTHMQVLLDDGLRAIVDRCLSIEPAGRYGSARELQAELPSWRRRTVACRASGAAGRGAVEKRTGLSV